MPDVLKLEELQQVMSRLKRDIPDLAEQADFQVECCRECCLFVRCLHKDCKLRAQALGMTIASLTMLRAGLNNWGDLRAIDAAAYVSFDPDAVPTTMTEKLLQCGFSKKQIEQKLLEIEHSLEWMHKIAFCGGRIGAAFGGAYVCLADSVCHLRAFCFSQPMESPGLADH